MKAVKEILKSLPKVAFETKTEAALWEKLRENDQIFDAWYPNTYEILHTFLKSVKQQIESLKPEGFSVKEIERGTEICKKNLLLKVFCFYKNDLPIALVGIEKNTKAVFVTAIRKANPIFQESFFKVHKPEWYANVPMLLSAFQVGDECEQILNFQHYFLDNLSDDSLIDAALVKSEIQMDLLTNYLSELTVSKGWNFNFSYATVKTFYTTVLANLVYDISKDNFSIIGNRKIEKAKFAVIKNDDLMAWGTIELDPSIENLLKFKVTFNQDFNIKPETVS